MSYKARMAKYVSPLLTEFQLEPLRGAAPVRFGMSREEVEQKLEARGCPLHSREDTKLSFFKGTIEVTFDAAGLAQLIEFRASADLFIRFGAINVFDTASREVAKAFGVRETTTKTIDLTGAKLYPGQILTLREAAKVNDHWGTGTRSIWGVVGIGSPSYFESVTGQAYVPPAKPSNAERFVHTKFGPASLVGKTGSGPEAVLELQFDDGITRRLKASFVNPA
jgi:hypothetical protein